MARQWKVKEYKAKGHKLFISIEDTVNNQIYSSYFRKKVNNATILNIFRNHVRERRAEILSKQAPLNLRNFEVTL